METKELVNNIAAWEVSRVLCDANRTAPKFTKEEANNMAELLIRKFGTTNLAPLVKREDSYEYVKDELQYLIRTKLDRYNREIF